MATKGTIGIKGLKTSGNDLTSEPGSLTVADNLIIPSADEMQSRRGQMFQSEYASGANGYIDGDATDSASNRAKELYQWGDALFVHYSGSGGGKLASFANWATSPSRALVGSYAEPEPTVTRMKFAQLAKSLSWTTDAGPYTLDVVGGTARRTGVKSPIILMGDADGGIGARLSGNVSATGSWFAKNQAVAYRAALAKKDANGRIIESASRSRVVVVNPNDVTVAIGGLARNANVVTATVTAHKFRVGDKLSLTLTGGDVGNFATANNAVTGVTSTTIVWAETAANYVNVASVTITSGTKSAQVGVGFVSGTAAAGDFIRLYRTAEIAGEALNPGDECYLCYERILTATDISNGYAVITDTTPSGFLGDPLDSNQNSGEGDLGVNERPPLCRDICVWDGRVWGAQTTDRHRLRLRLLGTGSPSGLQAGDLVAINTRVATAGSSFPLTTAYLPTENVARTTFDMGLYLNGVTKDVFSWQEFDGLTGLGEVQLEQAEIGSTMADGSGGAISAIYAATSRASAWGDPLAATKAVTAANTARTLGTTVTVRCAGHGFSAAQVIMLAYDHYGSSIDANFPVGLKTIATVVDANNFTYSEEGSNATLGSTYYAYAVTYKSDNNKQPVRFSRPGLPDAWPLANTLGGLPDGAEVLRIAPSGSGYSLIICLKDGPIYRVSGEYPYSVRRLDDTASLLAADSLVAHSGKLYGLTTQGMASISEAGVGIVGADIEDDTRQVWFDLVYGGFNKSVFFGVSYESDRQYQLWASNASSTVSRSYVFHSLSGQFSRLKDVGRTCGLVFRGQDRLVLGDANKNQLRVERKAFGDQLWTCFADESQLTSASGTQNEVSTISTGSLSWAPVSGDVLKVGGTYYLITGADLGAATISISGIASVTNGQTLTVYRAFGVALTLSPDAGGAPGLEKRWREVQFHFGAFLAKHLTVTFANERGASGSVTCTDSAFSITVPHSGVRTIRVAVPQSCQMCTTLTVSLSLSEAFSYFQLYGVSSTSESVSERTGK